MVMPTMPAMPTMPVMPTVPALPTVPTLPAYTGTLLETPPAAWEAEHRQIRQDARSAQATYAF